ncbi:hypothetical protein GCM10008995_12020 [Halobellus salinus]|uniref:Uncharacterized protein n=1 Tax=Halobellus salinus TaxID=931585 RepID=A0A830EEC3_9EURY|nr:hypothetical protein [Halobellus salinus]GGJ03792.1 hypothetical protein GCM10008995_12020 [Halobellus salinus]
MTPESDESFAGTGNRLIPPGRDRTPEDTGEAAVSPAGTGNVTDEERTVDGGIARNIV